jgi:hypothetical protein
MKQTGETENISTFLMRNLSDGGTYLLTEKELPEGSTVKVKFSLPFNRLTQLTGKKIAVSVEGVIVRRESKGVGIRFFEDYRVQYVSNGQRTNA